MTTQVATTFAAVAVLQCYENYGAHAWDGEGECPQYWKAKGGDDQVVREGITIAEASAEGFGDNMRQLALAQESRDDYFEKTLIDWRLDERSEATIAKVRERLEDQDDLSFHAYCAYKLDITTPTFWWAIGVMFERREIILSGYWAGDHGAPLTPQQAQRSHSYVKYQLL